MTPGVVRLSLILAVWALPAGPARAQDPGPESSHGTPAAPAVEDLVREALARSPLIAAHEARSVAARERIAPAGALPDPMLQVMVQGVGTPDQPVRGMTTGRFEYAQPLPWPGKLGAREDAAAADADVQAARTEEMRRAIAMQVRSAYGRLYALDGERVSLDAAREVLDLLSAAALARYASGQGEQEAVVKAQIEASRLRERLSDLEARRADVVAVVNRLLDRPAGAELGRVVTLPSPGIDAEDLVETALARSPTIAAHEAAVRAATRRLDAARLAARPDFLVGVGAGASLEPAPVVTLRVGIGLPVFKARKIDPEIAAARADLAAAHADLRAARAFVRAEMERLLAQWRRDREQVVRYREAIVPQSAVAVEAARASFLAGRGDFQTAVEDFRIWLEARVMLAAREADRFATWARIRMLAGPTVVSADEGGTS
jgi:outer membrane protein TolC